MDIIMGIPRQDCVEGKLEMGRLFVLMDWTSSSASLAMRFI